MYSGSGVAGQVIAGLGGQGSGSGSGSGWQGSGPAKAIIGLEADRSAVDDAIFNAVANGIHFFHIIFFIVYERRLIVRRTQER